MQIIVYIRSARYGPRLQFGPHISSFGWVLVGLRALWMAPDWIGKVLRLASELSRLRAER